MTDAGGHKLQIVDLGVMRYADALEVQRQTHRRVLEGRSSPTLVLVEHPPVITMSRRRGAVGHLQADPSTLANFGIEVEPTDRGGDITYHGPGQLVAYPILRLMPLGLSVSRYMRALEQVVIDTVSRFGIRAMRDPGATGVWVKRPAAGAAQSTFAKLCAMGVRVRKTVTMHGLALNVTTNLAHFQTIIPCGLVGRSVTSLRELLGDHTPSMQTVKHTLVAQMQRQFTGSIRQPRETASR